MFKKLPNNITFICFKIIISHNITYFPQNILHTQKHILFPIMNVLSYSLSANNFFFKITF